MEEIDSVHRELARLSIDQLRGTPSALNTLDIIESHPVPLRPKTISFLRKALRAAEGTETVQRIDRILFGCMDLAVEGTDRFSGGHAEILRGAWKDACGD